MDFKFKEDKRYLIINTSGKSISSYIKPRRIQITKERKRILLSNDENEIKETVNKLCEEWKVEEQLSKELFALTVMFLNDRKIEEDITLENVTRILTLLIKCDKGETITELMFKDNGSERVKEKFNKIIDEYGFDKIKESIIDLIYELSVEEKIEYKNITDEEYNSGVSFEIKSEDHVFTIKQIDNIINNCNIDEIVIFKNDGNKINRKIKSTLKNYKEITTVINFKKKVIKRMVNTPYVFLLQYLYKG